MDRLRFTHHISRQFNVELERVRSDVLRMGGLVEEQLGIALGGLRDRQLVGLERVREAEREINRLELSIDEACLRIMVRRQPAASDLRLLLSAGRIVADLERMGDEASRLARLTGRMLADAFEPARLDSLAELAQSVRRMLQQALDALARGDVRLAEQVMAADGQADRRYKQLIGELSDYMTRVPAIIPRAIDGLFAARALERIGDHCTNVSEHVIYLVRGEDIRHPKSRREAAAAAALNPDAEPVPPAPAPADPAR